MAKNVKQTRLRHMHTGRYTSRSQQ